MGGGEAESPGELLLVEVKTRGRCGRRPGHINRWSRHLEGHSHYSPYQIGTKSRQTLHRRHHSRRHHGECNRCCSQPLYHRPYMVRLDWPEETALSLEEVLLDTPLGVTPLENEFRPEETPLENQFPPWQIGVPFHCTDCLCFEGHSHYSQCHERTQSR